MTRTFSAPATGIPGSINISNGAGGNASSPPPSFNLAAIDAANSSNKSSLDINTPENGSGGTSSTELHFEAPIASSAPADGVTTEVTAGGDLGESTPPSARKVQLIVRDTGKLTAASERQAARYQKRPKSLNCEGGGGQNGIKTVSGFILQAQMERSASELSRINGGGRAESSAPSVMPCGDEGENGHCVTDV